MGASYAQRSAEMDREYRRAFASLPPARLAVMKRHGVGEALENWHGGNQGRDVGDYKNLREPLPTVSDRDRMLEAMAEMFDLPPATTVKLIGWVEGEIARESAVCQAKTLARVVGGLIGAGKMGRKSKSWNVAASVEGLLFTGCFSALNSVLDGQTMRERAKRVGCTTAYLSSMANMWVELLDLERPKGMKTQQARQNYSTARKKNHWRDQKCQQKKNQPHQHP